MKQESNRVVFVIGVSGCGKTTIGERLADRWQAKFVDADDLHSDANRQKMEDEIPLTDEDRAPWLADINAFAVKELDNNNLVVACSALKQIYRDQLANSIESQCEFVLLDGSFDLIKSRMENRDHFMPVGLLQSQFDDLEKPTDGIVINIDQSIEAVIDQVAECLGIAGS